MDFSCPCNPWLTAGRPLADRWPPATLVPHAARFLWVEIWRRDVSQIHEPFFFLIIPFFKLFLSLFWAACPLCLRDLLR